MVCGSWEDLWLLSSCARGLGFGSPLGDDGSCGGDGSDTSDLSIGTEAIEASEPAQSVAVSLPGGSEMVDSTVFYECGTCTV